MKFWEKQFLIKDQPVEKVKLTLQEFENKYQNFKSHWDFELISQQECEVTAQIVDHGYETPREKGQSDSPVFTVVLTPQEGNTLLKWRFQWKRSKRNLSWLLLWLLAVAGVILALTGHGDKLVLFMGIWLFWFILYAAWVLQNFIHDQISQNIFREMLQANFSYPGETDSRQESQSSLE